MDIFTKRKITRCRTLIPVNDICEIKREIVSAKKKKVEINRACTVPITQWNFIHL